MKINWSRVLFVSLMGAGAVVFLALVAKSANAQFAGTTCELTPGPCAERMARQAYAPVDRVLGRGSYGGVVIGGSRRAAVIGSVITGAVIGGALGGRRGAVIGGGVGFGASMLATRGGSAAAGPSAGGGQGDFQILNSTRYAVEVYRRDSHGKEKYLGRLASGESWAVEAPRPGEAYHGYVLIPNNSGGLSSDQIYPAPATNGWVFEEPAEAIAQEGGR